MVWVNTERSHWSFAYYSMFVEIYPKINDIFSKMPNCSLSHTCEQALVGLETPVFLKFLNNFFLHFGLWEPMSETLFFVAFVRIHWCSCRLTTSGTKVVCLTWISRQKLFIFHYYWEVILHLSGKTIVNLLQIWNSFPKWASHWLNATHLLLMIQDESKNRMDLNHHCLFHSSIIQDTTHN